MPTFISYSQKDTPLYESLCRELDGRGIKRWDAQTMRLTRPLSEQLREAINRCGDCIFLGTRNSLASGWSLAEVGAFWGAGKPVLTFVPDGDEAGAAPTQFRDKVWTSDLDRIVREIKGSRLKSPEESPGPLIFVSNPKDSSRDAAKLAVIREAWAQQPGGGGVEEQARPYYEFNALAQVIDDGDLAPRKGILLTTPYGQKLSEGLIADLVDWVRAGGNLAVACFELGERHHETNVNQLAYHFGVQFNSDVVVKNESERSPFDKDYGRTLLYDRVLETPRSLFRGVDKLAMKNACSLHLEPGGAPLLLAEPNRVIELLPESAVYSGAPAYKLAAGQQVFGKPYQDTERSVIALGPRGLTGDGRVLALGTWDFRSDQAESDNGQFLRNLYDWLTGRETQAGPAPL